MSTWVNYKAIKEVVSMEQVLAHYGVLASMHEKGDDLSGRCPIHKGTKNANSFHVSRSKNIFHCFGDCAAGGNVIDFVAMMEGGDKKNRDDVRRAALKLTEWFGLEFDRPKGGKSKAPPPQPQAQPQLIPDKAVAAAEAAELPKEKETDETGAKVKPVIEVSPAKVNVPLKFALNRLDPDHPYLASRGFTKETITHFGLGHCPKGIMAGRSAIPIHDEQGSLVAYAGRWPGDPPEGEGKYKFPMGFHKSLVVWNLHRAKEYAKEGGLIVVEGFFDAMRVWQAGFPNVVALMGSSMSHEQEALIVDAVGPKGKVALMLDEDEAGWKGREDATARLAHRVYVKVIGLGEEGMQPDTLSGKTITRLIHGVA